MNKQYRLLILLIICGALVSSCTDPNHPSAQGTDDGAAVIAFGSCLRQWQDQPVWKGVMSIAPSAFVFLGDNVYTDVGTYRSQAEPERIGQAYSDLGASEEFSEFRRYLEQHHIPLLATWDDHDYGVNDGGAHYRHKLKSKQYFLDFFKLASTATGDARYAGVYQSHRVHTGGLDVQIILLDTRSFRSPLNKSEASACSDTHNIPNNDPAATVLGAEQWQWLEQQLGEPADLRLVASSIQVLAEQHCYEKWANFPLQRQRLFDLIRNTAAAGVILISGDRHMAEISQADVLGDNYTLYEVTASGLNSAMGVGGRLILSNDNSLRSGSAYYEDNFGVIAIHSTHGSPQIGLQIRASDGTIVEQQLIALDSLKFQH